MAKKLVRKKKVLTPEEQAKVKKFQQTATASRLLSVGAGRPVRATEVDVRPESTLIKGEGRERLIKTVTQPTTTAAPVEEKIPEEIKEEVPGAQEVPEITEPAPLDLDPTKTREQQLQDILKEFFGRDVDLSPAGLLKEREETKLQEKLRKQEDISRVRRLEEEQRTLREEQLERERAAALGQIETRGAVTGPGVQVARGITGAIARERRRLQDTRTQLEQRITRSQQDLERAQEAGDIKVAEEIRRQLKRDDALIRQVELEEAKAEREEKKLGIDRNLQAFGIISKLPSGTFTTPEAVTGLFESLGGVVDDVTAAGLSSQFAEIAKLEESKTQSDLELAELKKQQLQAQIQQIGVKEETAAQQDFNFFRQLQNENPELAERFAKLKGFSVEETPLQIAQRQKIEAETSAINNILNPGSLGRSINISDVSTGESLPLQTLGLGMRTDRHNNPVASKAYKSTLDILKNSGLTQGIDFDIGETTEGIDSDGVATVMFSSPEAGTRGAIAVLEAGQLSSWYANQKYGGHKKILNKIEELSGQEVNSFNVQDTFNSLTEDAKADVVKEIYQHEGGTQLFKPSTTDVFKETDLTRARQGKLTGKDLQSAQIRAVNGGYEDEFIDAMISQSAEPARLLPADKAIMLSDARFIPEVLDNLEITIQSGEASFSPVWGAFRSFNPFDVEQKTADAELRRTAQLVGKFMEGGVLRAEDERKYRAMLPQTTDERQVALNKLNGVREMLATKAEMYIGDLARVGFDVSAFEGPLTQGAMLPGADNLQADIEFLTGGQIEVFSSDELTEIDNIFK